MQAPTEWSVSVKIHIFQCSIKQVERKEESGAFLGGHFVWKSSCLEGPCSNIFRVSLAFVPLSNLRDWFWLLCFYLSAMYLNLSVMIWSCFQHATFRLIACWSSGSVFLTTVNMSGDGALSILQNSAGWLQCVWLMKCIRWHTGEMDVTYCAHFIYSLVLTWKTPAAKASEKHSVSYTTIRQKTCQSPGWVVSPGTSLFCNPPDAHQTEEGFGCQLSVSAESRAQLACSCMSVCTDMKDGAGRGAVTLAGVQQSTAGWGHRLVCMFLLGTYRVSSVKAEVWGTSRWAAGRRMLLSPELQLGTRNGRELLMRCGGSRSLCIM